MPPLKHYKISLIACVQTSPWNCHMTFGPTCPTTSWTGWIPGTLRVFVDAARGALPVGPRLLWALLGGTRLRLHLTLRRLESYGPGVPLCAAGHPATHPPPTLRHLDLRLLENGLPTEATVAGGMTTAIQSTDRFSTTQSPSTSARDWVFGENHPYVHTADVLGPLPHTGDRTGFATERRTLEGSPTYAAV